MGSRAKSFPNSSESGNPTGFPAYRREFSRISYNEGRFREPYPLRAPAFRSFALERKNTGRRRRSPHLHHARPDTPARGLPSPDFNGSGGRAQPAQATALRPSRNRSQYARHDRPRLTGTGTQDPARMRSCDDDRLRNSRYGSRGIETRGNRLHREAHGYRGRIPASSGKNSGLRFRRGRAGRRFRGGANPGCLGRLRRKGRGHLDPAEKGHESRALGRTRITPGPVGHGQGSSFGTPAQTLETLGTAFHQGELRSPT